MDISFMIWESRLRTRVDCIYVVSLVDPDLLKSAPFFVVTMCGTPIINGRDKAMGVMVYGTGWITVGGDHAWPETCLLIIIEIIFNFTWFGTQLSINVFQKGNEI